MDDITPIPFGTSAAGARGSASRAQVFFDRLELSRILSTYGRGVAAGIWRDYSILEGGDCVGFCCHVRHSEMPEYRIMKVPDLSARQGAWSLVGAAGQVLKRGHTLDQILNVLERKLFRLVEA